MEKEHRISCAACRGEGVVFGAVAERTQIRAGVHNGVEGLMKAQSWHLSRIIAGLAQAHAQANCPRFVASLRPVARPEIDMAHAHLDGDFVDLIAGGLDERVTLAQALNLRDALLQELGPPYGDREVAQRDAEARAIRASREDAYAWLQRRFPDVSLLETRLSFQGCITHLRATSMTLEMGSTYTLADWHLPLSLSFDAHAAEYFRIVQCYPRSAKRLFLLEGMPATLFSEARSDVERYLGFQGVLPPCAYTLVVRLVKDVPHVPFDFEARLLCLIAEGSWRRTR